MASLFLQCTTLLSILLLILHPPTTVSSDELDSLDEYVIDSPASTMKSRSRIFTKRIRKDMKCSTNHHEHGFNVCEGVSANAGNALLWCCNGRCRDVFSDIHHCGFCGHRCPFGLFCCHGRCTDIMRNPMHCGMCHHRCPPGVPCDHGFCGYA